MSRDSTICISNALGRRIAEEAQLLAEEKWTIDALTKIKNQRNSLQIERLHLESMKAQLKSSERAKSTKPRDEVMEPSTSALNLMQSVRQPDSTESVMEFVSTPTSIEEALCNEQELNLSVTNSIFSQNIDPLSMNVQEEEEDDDDGEDDGDDENNLLVDINMLMEACTD